MENELNTLLDNPKFSAAVSAYKDDPLRVAKVQYNNRMIDPRPFIKVQEAVENAAIHVLGWNRPKAQVLGQLAERHAVQHAGLDWAKYQAAVVPIKPRRVSDSHPILKNAQRAKDGNFYIPDTKRPGKYLMVR